MKAVAITGATSGIGLAVCRALAASGHAVLGVGRTDERCRKTEQMLRGEFPQGSFAFFCADLTSLAQVERAGREIGAYVEEHFGGKLHALINNAGGVRSAYTTTEDGYETVFALNHLAGFVLARVLMPQLVAGGGRLIMTSSASHRHTDVRWRDIMFRRGYRPLGAYKQSKLMNLLFACGFRDRFSALGVDACCVDPGLVRTDIGLKGTGGPVRWVWKLRMRGGAPPEECAKTYAFLVDAPVHPQGLYYSRSRPVPHSRQVTQESADRLWAISETLGGARFSAEGGEGQ